MLKVPLLVHYFPIIYLLLNCRIFLQFVAAETIWISNMLVPFTFNMGDQDYDAFFSKKMFQTITIAFDQAASSKTTTPRTKIPSSIIEERQPYI